MTEDGLLPFDLAAVQRKKVTAYFAGKSISSDGNLAEALTGCFPQWRDLYRVVHTLPAMFHFCMFAITSGGVCPRVGDAGPGEGCR